MKPITYYSALRTGWGYTPAMAAMATMAFFCKREGYWERTQGIADYLNGRNPDTPPLLTNKTYTGMINLNQMANSICHDCTIMSHFHGGNQFKCHSANADQEWPGRLSPKGYMMTCPAFTPFIERAKDESQ